MIREIDVSTLRDLVARLIVEANYNIPADILQALRDAVAREESPLGRRTLEQLVRNYEMAAAERRPVCQDSGLAVVMLETGQDVHWTGGSLQEAIYEGIREGTKSGYLRWSMTGDPTRMLQTAGGDTPGVIHIEDPADHARCRSPGPFRLRQGSGGLAIAQSAEAVGPGRSINARCDSPQLPGRHSRVGPGSPPRRRFG